MSFAPDTEILAKPEALLRVPVGLASPLWGLFAGAAVGGAAWWWMTRWTRVENLEAMFGAAAKFEAAVEPKTVAPPTEVVETVEAAAEPLAEAAGAGRTFENLQRPVAEQSRRRLVHDPRQQLLGRLDVWNMFQKLQASPRIRGELGAQGTTCQVRFQLSALRRRKRTVEVVAQQNFDVRAIHNAARCFFSSLASSARPRLSRDLTVPSGISNTNAISRYSISCKSRNITVSRSSGDSFSSAACRISPCSRTTTAPSGRLDDGIDCSSMGS